MDIENFINDQSGWLTEAGFSLAEHRTGLARLGQIYRFTSDSVDVEIRYDRMDKMTVGVGSVGGTAFEYRVWGMLLNLSFDEGSDFDDQWLFFKSNMKAIQQYAEGQNDLEEQLTNINWRLAKDALGLPPDMKRPGKSM